MTVTSERADDRRGRVRIEQGCKRVRAVLGGEIVADTTRPVLVWEVPYYPAYYVPLADVRAELRPDGETVHSPSRGDAGRFTVVAGGREAPGGVVVGAGGGRRPRGPRMGVPHASARKPEDRRAGRLLRREGRRPCRRGA